MKIFKKLAFLLLIAAGMLGIFACGDDGSSSGGGNPDGGYYPEEEPTYYATYVYDFEDGNGEQVYKKLKIDFDTGLFEDIEGPERPGWVFTGWYNEYDMEMDGNTHVSPYDQKFYARYERGRYKVRLIANGSEMAYNSEREGGYEITPDDEIGVYGARYALSDEVGGYNFFTDYIFYRACYEDAAMTKKLDDTFVITKDIDIYCKYFYCPVTFETNGNEVTITEFIGESDFPYDVLELPVKYNGKPVTAIGQSAFADLDVEEVIIPDGIKKIEANAFSGSAIKRLTVPDSVEKIGDGAFENCINLTNATIGINATFDPNQIFGNSHSVAAEEYGGARYFGRYLIGVIPGEKEISIRPGCVEIPASAFDGAQITSLELPDSVTKINARAFAGSRFTELVIPATVTTIADGAFEGCSLLVDLTVETEASFNFDLVFKGCTAIAGEEYENAIYFGNNFLRPVNDQITWARIKSGCTVIPESAFEGCSKLTKVFVPKSVKRIKANAFKNVLAAYFTCYFEGRYSDITFESGANATGTSGLIFEFNKSPNSLMISDDGVAYGFENMVAYTGVPETGAIVYGYFGDATELTIPQTFNNLKVQVIYPNAFMDNDTLTSITVQDCAVIGSAAFWNTSALETVTFGNVSHVGIRAFYDCNALESVTFGNVNILSKQAFEECGSLTTLTAANEIKLWNDDASQSESFAAGDNLASAVTGDKLYWWGFTGVLTKTEVEQLLAAYNQ